MKAVLFAYHEVGAATLEAMLRNGVDVAAVFTHRDDPSEGGWFRSVARIAAENGIPVHAPDDVNHPIWVARVRDMEPDSMFSAHYRKMIGSDMLDVCPNQCYNIHASMLPKYRGRCPINWVLIGGETETGITLHHMTAAADAGDIVAQRAVTIDDDDTAATLMASIVDATTVMLDEALPAIADGTAISTPQDASAATTFPGRCPEDGHIDWSDTAESI
ncbi:MAG TPA: bifunctional UDP-glucuronic acid oxidase/UDP-4-amino-4-deoxy-L-arabinose formyltransferase, partial [Phycisphaerales bacterium]|nr:bifunctional UDP-glucuronic acid oxidase/UDP-4-amino-4-deoxy-L-arabinose formyltransferase [Phycisphaerales bacterium]